MSDAGDDASPHIDEATESVTALAHLEGRLARPFADRAAILVGARVDEHGLARLRGHVVSLLEDPAAGPLRAAFQRAFDRARSDDLRGPGSPASQPPAERSAGAPAMASVADVPRFTPSYLLSPTPAAASPPPADAPDETAFLALARPGPTLPFVEGDARAFIEASRVDVDGTEGVSSPEEDGDDPEASSGDATQALDLRKLVEDVVPFQLEVERSLTAFVDLLVALTSAPGREDEVGARFGVPTRTERERVLAGWRRRWDVEPGLRAEWQRLYQVKVAGSTRG